MTKRIRTRFAPSPTGYLHIWGLRTALYAFLQAKKNNWDFLLRIEDTDRARLVDNSVEKILSNLEYFNLTPDESVKVWWDYWPYIQSERLDIYKKYIDKLLDSKNAYYCFCSGERLSKLRAEQEELKLPTKYDKKCRNLTPDEIKDKLDNNEDYVVRMKIPENEKITFTDTVKWKVTFESNEIDDQVILKTDKFPTYHLAAVVDDNAMKISHVIRGDEWLSSTPKHILLYKYLGFELPIFSHLPLILWKDKKKLSKRTWDVSVDVYIAKWYLKDAVLNYIALLWWNPKTTEEVFTLEELINIFELKNINKSWAIFDEEKLEWINSKHLAKTDSKIVKQELEIFLKEYESDFYKDVYLEKEDSSKNTKNNFNFKLVTELKSKFRKFSEFKGLTKCFYNNEVSVDNSKLLHTKMKILDLDMAKKSLEITLDLLENNKNLISILDNLDIKSEEDYNKTKQEIAWIFVERIKAEEMKNWQVLWPTRVALTWEDFSPGAFECMIILGREMSIERISKVIASI